MLSPKWLRYSQVLFSSPAPSVLFATEQTQHRGTRRLHPCFTGQSSNGALNYTERAYMSISVYYIYIYISLCVCVSAKQPKTAESPRHTLTPYSQNMTSWIQLEHLDHFFCRAKHLGAAPIAAAAELRECSDSRGVAAAAVDGCSSPYNGSTGLKTWWVAKIIKITRIKFIKLIEMELT